MLLSLAMIVKNEEETLAHCLESVKPIVDEMVIVDTGSTDKTVEIAKGFGASVHHFQWCDDFAAARNESLKHCSGEWVLIIDADEAIDPLDYEKIKNACLNPLADAYILITRNYFYNSLNLLQADPVAPNTSPYSEGSHLPYYADNTALRLARLYDGLAFSSSVHETLHPSLTDSGKTIENLDAVLHHYGNLFKDREEHKTHYYLMLACKEAEKNPHSMYAHFNVMQQAIAAEMWELALRSADACIGISPKVDLYILYGRAKALQELGRHGDALQQLDSLLAQVPDYAPALLLGAISLAQLGDLDLGRMTVQHAISSQPNQAPSYMCLIHWDIRENRIDAAKKTLAEALKIFPSEPGFYDQLLFIEQSEANYSNAAKIAAQALKACPGKRDGEWESIIFQYSSQMAERELALNNFDSARQEALQGLEGVPDEPRLYDILIKIETQRGDMQRAAQDAIRGIQNCPGGNPLWYRLAAAYLGQVGERQTAVSILDLGLKAFPDDPDLSKLVGIV